jgi:hypothetical protein
MFILDLLAALMIGLVVVWFVSIAFNTKGPWDSFLWFFLAVGLFAWVGGIWMVPFGPSWGGIGWLPFAFMGILAVLMLTAASPRSSRRRGDFKGKAKTDEEARIGIDIFFWGLIICLLIFGTSHYIWFPRVL